MCLVCVSPFAPTHWTEQLETGTSSELSLRRQHYRRVTVLRAVLAGYGLTVGSAAGGRGLLISDRKGTSRHVEHAGQLWPAVDELSRRPVDPLDPELLHALEPT